MQCTLVFFFELVNVFGKIPCLAAGTSLLSFSLFMGPILEFYSVRTSLMSRFDLYFSKRSRFPVPDTRVTWRGLKDFLHRVSTKLFRSLRNECIRVLRCTTRLWYAFHNSHSAFVFTFSSFCESSLSSAFYLVVHQPCNEETNTCLLTYNPLLLWKIRTRVDANIHKAFACKYPANNICTVVEQWTVGYSLPRILLFLDTLRPRDTVGSDRLCVLVFAYDLVSRGGNCNGLLATTGLFLSTGNRYLFLLQRRLVPFDSWPLLLFRFSRVWRQSFVIEVSDLYSYSPLSSISDYWASISSDRFPCRTILIRFWVDQTHVFSICTDFPRYHRMEFLT